MKASNPMRENRNTVYPRRAQSVHHGSASVDVIGTVEDITERKRMESELRTSKEMAEASNRAKAHSWLT